MLIFLSNTRQELRFWIIFPSIRKWGRKGEVEYFLFRKGQYSYNSGKKKLRQRKASTPPGLNTTSTFAKCYIKKKKIIFKAHSLSSLFSKTKTLCSLKILIFLMLRSLFKEAELCTSLLCDSIVWVSSLKVMSFFWQVDIWFSQHHLLTVYYSTSFPQMCSWLPC